MARGRTAKKTAGVKTRGQSHTDNSSTSPPKKKRAVREKRSPSPQSDEESDDFAEFLAENVCAAVGLSKNGDLLVKQASLVNNEELLNHEDYAKSINSDSTSKDVLLCKILSIVENFDALESVTKLHEQNTRKTRIREAREAKGKITEILDALKFLDRPLNLDSSDAFCDVFGQTAELFAVASLVASDSKRVAEDMSSVFKSLLDGLVKHPKLTQAVLQSHMRLVGNLHGEESKKPETFVENFSVSQCEKKYVSVMQQVVSNAMGFDRNYDRAPHSFYTVARNSSAGDRAALVAGVSKTDPRKADASGSSKKAANKKNTSNASSSKRVEPVSLDSDEEDDDDPVPQKTAQEIREEKAAKAAKAADNRIKLAKYDLSDLEEDAHVYSKEILRMFPKGVTSTPGRGHGAWSTEQTRVLEKAVVLHGKSWSKIQSKYGNQLGGRNQMALKDKARNEIKRRRNADFPLCGFEKAC